MMFSNNCRARSPLSGSVYKTPTVGFRMGRACKIGPRSFSILTTASNWVRETANGALFTVAMRWPGIAKLKFSAGDREAEIQRRGDDHAGRAVDLLQQVVVHQHATFLGGLQIGPAARRQADLEASAAHLAGYRADRIVFADLAFLQFGHPNGCHTLGFEDPDVVVADYMSLRQ